MYDVYSKHADDFINHEEILETLAYADENKANEALIDSILEKARLRKGLSHREASVLLACQMEEKNQEIYKLAEQIKKDFYGNRIVMFAPLYLSNYCVNGCTYCPYHLKNKHIARKQLTQEEIRKEVIALQDMGHKRLALEAGEDPGVLSGQHQHHLQHQTQKRRHPTSEHQYRSNHCGQLSSAQRSRDRHLYPVSGDVSQGELSDPPSDRTET